MKKNILVVGGAGFIGSHLCRKLVKQEHMVYCLDNLITGKEDNIWDLVEIQDCFFFRVGDVTEPFVIEDACLGRDIDEIYYLASIASPEKYIRHPLQTIDANVEGVCKALELAMAQNAKLLYTSTSEVYGNPKKSPQSETYFGNVDCTSDRAVYDESKRLGETIVSLFRRRYNVNACIVRIFNTYGPGMAVRDGRAIPNFIEQALEGKPFTIYGEGEQTRSFCYISDMVEGLLKAMDVCFVDPINLGNPNEYYSINELVKLIKVLTNSSSKCEFLEYPTQRDPQKRRPLITRARQTLKWKPTIDIKTGLENTIKYFKDIKNGNGEMESNIN